MYACHHLIWRSGCIKPVCAVGQILTSAQGQAQQRTQLLTSHSYTDNVLSPLWAWKISTRDTEGKKLTGMAWHCLWYPFLGHFYTHHLLRSRALHPSALTTTTTTQPCFFSVFFFQLSRVSCVQKRQERGDPSRVCSNSQELSLGDGAWNKAENQSQNCH